MRVTKTMIIVAFTLLLSLTAIVFATETDEPAGQTLDTSMFTDASESTPFSAGRQLGEADFKLEPIQAATYGLNRGQMTEVSPDDLVVEIIEESGEVHEIAIRDGERVSEGSIEGLDKIRIQN